MRYQSTSDALRIVFLVMVVSAVIGAVISMLTYSLLKHLQRCDEAPAIQFEEPVKPP